MTHDPLCVLADPCEPDHPAHGYCSFSAPRFCIHCQQWCICDRLAKARSDEREQAVARIVAATGRTCCPACVIEGQEHTCLVPDAIAAARGETP